MKYWNSERKLQNELIIHNSVLKKFCRNRHFYQLKSPLPPPAPALPEKFMNMHGVASITKYIRMVQKAIKERQLTDRRNHSRFQPLDRLILSSNMFVRIHVHLHNSKRSCIYEAKGCCIRGVIFWNNAVGVQA